MEHETWKREFFMVMLFMKMLFSHFIHKFENVLGLPISDKALTNVFLKINLKRWNVASIIFKQSDVD